MQATPGHSIPESARHLAAVMGGAHKQPGLLMSIKTSPQQDEAELYALERGCKEFIHCFIEFQYDGCAVALCHRVYLIRQNKPGYRTMKPF